MQGQNHGSPQRRRAKEQPGFIVLPLIVLPLARAKAGGRKKAKRGGKAGMILYPLFCDTTGPATLR
jgi:hypothetical protein